MSGAGPEPAPAQDLDGLLEQARVAVCIGPGGAGKTTTAAALAIAAALRGRRVVVLTVDPAARLKDALELPPRAGEIHRVPLPDAAGELDAVLLDAKGLFDQLVRRLAPTPSLAERILSNPVYRNVAGAFAGSDAYMALEQVLDIASSGRYDLVVVDTPPASHALDLFDAPERVLALLQSRALEYLEEPIRILGGVTSRLARGILGAVLSALERVTGLSLLSDVSSLAADFRAVAPGFRHRAGAIRDLLRAPETRYVLVTTAESHVAREVLAFAAQAARVGVRADAVVVNRVLAIDGQAPRRPVATEARSAAAAGGTWPAALARSLVACAQDLEATRHAERAVVARLRTGLRELDRGDASARLWLELPALSPAPVTLADVTALAGSLRRDRPPSTSAA